MRRNISFISRMPQIQCNSSAHKLVNKYSFKRHILYLKKNVSLSCRTGYPFSFVLVVNILSFVSVAGSAQTFTCSTNNQECDLTKCKEITNCDQLVRNFCNCCDVCIRDENQPCGGWYDQHGICADGLVCIISFEKGRFIHGSESGNCKASNSSCPELNSYYGCTVSNNECHCMNITSCTKPFFHFASKEDCELVLSSQTTISTECANVSCPLDEEVCSADSYKLPSVFSPAHCCPVHQGCACLPTTCKPKECPEGKHPKVLKLGNRKPGLCCSSYECVSASELECEFNGKRYNNTDVWQADKCTVCSCQSAIIFCQPAKCPDLPFCSLVSVPEGECCAVCSGCLSPSGKPYNNSDSWTENDCMTCQCVNGQVKCQEQMCQTTCENPQKLHGYCCPVCKGDSIEQQREKCPPVTNCTCLGTLLTNKVGCPICDCKEQECPSLIGCKKECQYGFAMDKNGCRKCKCKKCPSMEKCDKTCPMGFNADYQGCSVCECKGEPTPVLSTAYPTSNWQPCWMEGKIKNHGDHWQIPPCFNCTCNEGHITCFQEACPPISCPHPVMVRGHCCPVCFDVRHLNECEYEGRIYRNGEQWIIDDCTQCTCRNRQVICTEKICPRLRCSQLIHVPGQCCPLCTGHAAKDTEWSLMTVVTSACVIFLLLLIVGLLVIVIRKQHNIVCSSLSPPNMTTRPKSVNLELQGAARFDNTNKALFAGIDLKKLDNVPIITTVNNMM